MNGVLTRSRDEREFSTCEPLVWSARLAAAPSGGRFAADTSTRLLRTIAGVLDIRSVFSRVSDIVQQVVPHDALALNFIERLGPVTLEARSTEDLPAHGWPVNAEDKGFSITSDLRRARSRSSESEPTVVEAFLAAGYRSVLCVRAVAQDQVIALVFVSRRANA